MTNIAEYVAQLAEDLNKSDQCRAIKTKLIHSKQADQGKALEEAIQQLRGEVTATDRKCLELISNWQLIQVLCAGATGHLPDLDAAIFKSPVKGFMLRDATPTSGVDRSLKETFTPVGHDPKLYWLAEQFRRSFAPAERDFLITASEEAISKTHNLPASMTAIQLLKYGLPATIASDYSEGLGELHDRMMESRSASKSLLQPLLTETPIYRMRDGVVVRREGTTPLSSSQTVDASRFESFQQLFNTAAEMGVPFGVTVETSPVAVRFVMDRISQESVKQALDSGVTGIIGGPLLLELLRKDDDLSRFFLVGLGIDEQLAQGEEVKRAAGMLDYTSIFITAVPPSGYEDKFLYVLSKQNKE